jgi:hypothetical protein
VTPQPERIIDNLPAIGSILKGDKAQRTLERCSRTHNVRQSILIHIPYFQVMTTGMGVDDLHWPPLTRISTLVLGVGIPNQLVGGPLTD